MIVEPTPRAVGSDSEARRDAAQQRWVLAPAARRREEPASSDPTIDGCGRGDNTRSTPEGFDTDAAR